MPARIDTLPYELLSTILLEATDANLHEIPRYTYGLSKAPEPLHEDVRIQRVVRGHMAPDATRWEATNSIRQVNRRWHEWAIEHAMKDLYIRRWRGSERWMDSRNLATLRGKFNAVTVYRDPYYSLKQAAQLLARDHDTAALVRRLWFDGFYSFETLSIMFDTLRYCKNLNMVTLPWSALRYGSGEDWSKLLGQDHSRKGISSLELLAVDLKAAQMANTINQIDRKPLESRLVNFGGLRRLKIFGSTNFMPIVDEDIIKIARTATSLEELHVTGTSSITVKGIMAIVEGSRETLRVLEYSPPPNANFEHPDPAIPDTTDHYCQMLLRCPQLRNLSISLPSICSDLFCDSTIRWCGEVQVRAGGICGFQRGLKHSVPGQQRFWDTIKMSRSLMEAREEDGDQLDIEIFINHWIFEPRDHRVHGNIIAGEVLSDMSWPVDRRLSSKGPYGSTSVYGKEEGPYSSISEKSFIQGVQHGYISF